ncbi:hypothetical protein [Streptomyces sp. L2]|uniref:hypothetical protein n=1 Tax=Streptomyces sp. L2 TaxID=2162665 RepID=UPI00101025BB|nr:hypothetical protein [Streptomyces sp. L2]
MGWFSSGRDRQLAATRYVGRESASDRAARQRRDNHKRTGARDAARAGQAWEDRDRAAERGRRWYRPAR